MLGFEQRISGVGSDHSANCATTAAINCPFYIYKSLIKFGPRVVFFEAAFIYLAEEPWSSCLRVREFT